MSFQIWLNTCTKKKKNGDDTNYTLPSRVQLFRAENKIGLTPPQEIKKMHMLFFPPKS